MSQYNSNTNLLSANPVRARNTEGPSEMSEPVGSGNELSMDQLEFHPNYYMASWIDREAGMAERLTIVMSLPSGISGHNVKFSVKAEGMILQVDAPWPEPLQDPTFVCGPFINNANIPNYTNNHPEVIALEKAMKQIKVDAGNNKSEVLQSKARIRLPVRVNPSKIDSYVFGFIDTEENGGQANTLHVRLFVDEGDYDDQEGRPNVISIRPAHPTQV